MTNGFFLSVLLREQPEPNNKKEPSIFRKLALHEKFLSLVFCYLKVSRHVAKL